MRTAVLAIAVAAGLAGCAATTAVKVQCLPMKTYTPEQQAAMAAELQALPETSAIGEAMADYGQLRAEDRACLAAAK